MKRRRTLARSLFLAGKKQELEQLGRSVPLRNATTIKMDRIYF
jgi:hypothetical protein